MTWLLLGAGGQLGMCLQQVLTEEGITFRACNHSQVDIADLESIKNAVSECSPCVVVNLAAWTNVDGAESHRDEAFLINSTGAENVAVIAAASKIPLIHLSTDYVFDGTKNTPYKTTDTCNPLSVYGASKLAGEKLVQAAHPYGSWIVRTAWLYSPFGKNFARTIAKRGLTGDGLSIVSDSLGQPTSALALARQLVRLVEANPPPGIFHGTNSGSATWYEFATEIVRPIEHHGTITAVDSSEFPTIATRPQYSVLDHSEWAANGIPDMPHWRVSLHEVLGAIIDSVKE